MGTRGVRGGGEPPSWSSKNHSTPEDVPYVVKYIASPPGRQRGPKCKKKWVHALKNMDNSTNIA